VVFPRSSLGSVDIKGQAGTVKIRKAGGIRALAPNLPTKPRDLGSAIPPICFSPRLSVAVVYPKRRRRVFSFDRLQFESVNSIADQFLSQIVCLEP
jgi:hypothetical protein